jgi:WD40 repeat protein
VTERTGRRAALIVANDAYDDPKLPSLRAPLRDARRLASVLADPEIGGFEVEFSENDPDHVLRQKLGDFFGDRQRDDFLLVHFAGHGVTGDDNALYLATPNTRWGRFETTALPADTVIRLMEKSQSKRIVVLLDCCYSGAFGQGAQPRSGQSVQLAERFGRSLGAPTGNTGDLDEDGQGIAVLTASQGIERAFEGDDLSLDEPSSFFTGALVRGLETGEADVDEDGHVSISDLYDYVDRDVRDRTPNQHPGFWVYRGRGRLRVARRPRLSLAVSASRDYSKLQPQHVLHEGEDEIFSVAVSPDRKTVAAATDGAILVWRSDDELRRWNEARHPTAERLIEVNTFVYAVTFSHDGTLLASSDEDGIVRITDVATGQTRNARREHKEGEGVYSVAFSPDNALLVSGGYDGQVIVWDVENGAARRRDRGGRRVSSVAFSPQTTERLVAIGRLDDSVSLWNVDRPGRPTEIGRHRSSVESVAFSPDGRLLATCGLDKAVRVWNVDESVQVWENTDEHEYVVRSVAFSPNGETVVSASWDKTIKLWDTQTGLPAELREDEEKRHTDWIWSVGFSSDGLALLSAGSDGKIIVWTFGE